MMFLRRGLTAGAVAVSLSLFGGVFDDAAWVLQPNDLNGNGLIDKGEVVNGLKGGTASDTSNQSVPYGFDENRKIENVTVGTAFLPNVTLPALYIADAPRTDGGTTTYCPGVVDATTAIRSCLRPAAEANAFTVVVRTKCQDVTSNTRWVFNWNGPEVGFTGGKVRFYAYNGKDEGFNNATDMPVTADTWIDLAFTVTYQPELVDGVTVTTGKAHFVMMRADTGDKIYRHDCYLSKNFVPNQGTTQIDIGSEGVFKGGAETTDVPNAKRYKGWIQQLAIWNRALTDEEMLEAFHADDGSSLNLGVKNGSAAEFGGTSTEFSLNGAWSAAPASIAQGDSWTVKVNPGADYAKDRNLVFSAAEGTGVLTAKVGSGEPFEMDVWPGFPARLYLPAADFTSGENTITLSCTEGGPIALDQLSLVEGGKIAKRYVLDTAKPFAEKPAADTVAAGETIEMYVAQGVQAKLEGYSLSGAGRLLKTGPGTLYFNKGKLAFTGDFEVEEGVAQTSYARGVSGFGGGTTRVHAENGARVQIGCSFADALEIVGAEKTGMRTVRFDMGSFSDYAISFTGTLTASEGATVDAAAAPAGVTFGAAVTAGAFGAHAGTFTFASAGNVIDELVIGSARVICGVNSCFGTDPCPTALRFTGESLDDDWGYLDMNGHHLYLRSMTAPDTLTAESEGCRILNSGSLATLYPGNKNAKAPYTTYVKLDGLITLGFVSSMGDLTFGPRRHTLSGELNFSVATKALAGCSFENVTAINVNSGVTVDFSALGAGALKSLKTLGNGSSCNFLINAASVTPRQMDLVLTGVNTTSFKNSATITVSGGRLEVNQFKYYDWTTYQETDAYKDNYAAWVAGGKKDDDYKKAINSGANAYKKNVPLGVYEAGGPFGNKQINTGSEPIFAYGGESPKTPIVWTGANGESTSIATADNWKDSEGNVLESSPDVSLPYMLPTFADGGTVAQVLGTVNFYGMIFSLANNASKSFALEAGDETALLCLQQGGLVCNDALDAGTSYEISAPLKITSAVSLAIPSNGVFSLTGGISGPGSLTLDGRAQQGCVSGESTKAVTVGGTFYLGGSNVFSGALTASAAVLHLGGVLGTAEDATKFTFTTSSGKAEVGKVIHGNLRFEGAEVNKEVEIRCLGQSVGVSNVHSAVVFAENTTNTFVRKFSNGASNVLTLESGARAVFGGELACSASQDFRGISGASFVFNGPINVPSAEKGRVNFSSACTDTTVDLNATGGTAGQYVDFGCYGNVVNVNADNPFASVGQYTALGDGNVNKRTCTMNLNDADYTTSGLYLKKTAIVQGTGTLVVTGGQDKDGNPLVSYSRGTVAGAAGVTVAIPADETFTFDADSVSTSTGLLTAAGGTVKFATGTSWAGSVRVSGGKLDLPKSLRLVGDRFLYVGDSDEPAADGVYGATGSGAQYEVDWLVGPGKIRVGKIGMLLLVR